MSFVSLYVHVVFSTKNRKPLLNDSIRSIVFNHMIQNAREKSIKVIALNGYVNHVHCFIALDRNKSLSETVRMIKGESSYWINKLKLTETKFAWQDDYWAESIYRDQIPLVKRYIENQENHHGVDVVERKGREFFKKNEPIIDGLV